MYDEKTGTMKLSKPEAALIVSIRRQKIAHGRIRCIIFIQDSKLIRTELEKVIESIKL